MMFSCIKHGWTSFEKPCSVCSPVITFSSSSSVGAMIGVSESSWSELYKQIEFLKSENDRYREALEFCAYKFVEDPAVQICHECEFGYDKIASIAYKALKGGE